LLLPARSRHLPQVSMGKRYLLYVGRKIAHASMKPKMEFACSNVLVQYSHRGGNVSMGNWHRVLLIAFHGYWRSFHVSFHHRIFYILRGLSAVSPKLPSFTHGGVLRWPLAAAIISTQIVQI
jgi:hypothetical protein